MICQNFYITLPFQKKKNFRCLHYPVPIKRLQRSIHIKKARDKKLFRRKFFQRDEISG